MEEYYYLKGDDDFKKKLFKKLKFLFLFLFIFSIIGGLVRFRGILYNRYLLFFYMLEIIVILLLANGLYILISHNGVLTEKEYRKSIAVFKVYAILLFIFLTLSFIASIVYVFIYGFDNDLFWFIIYLLLKILMFYLTYLFKNSIDDLDFDTKERV